MRTPLLIDVPKTALSRSQKIDAFCKANGIVTIRAKGMSFKDYPWTAAHLPRARKMGYGVTQDSTLFDCVSKVGRLMEEAGIMVNERTKRDAVEQLCRNIGIEFKI